MTKDLTQEVQAVFAARSVETKKVIVLEMIKNSYAKVDTKRLLSTKASMINNANKLDKFAVDYALSGEGMKVR